MSIILFGKLMAGGGAIVAVSVGSIFLSRHLNRDVGPYFVVVVESTADSSNGSEFKCKMYGESDPTKFPCKVEQLKWEDSKKHLDYSATTAYEAATSESLKVANNVFKITVPKEQYESVKIKYKTIEISHTTKDSKEHVTANAKILFTVDADGTTFNGKAEYFVSKAPSTVASLETLTGGDTYQCAWEKTPMSGFKDCEIYDFAATDHASGQTLSGSSTYKELLFQKTATKSTTISEHKHYLIKFTEEKTPIEKDLDKKQIVFIKKGGDVKTTSVEFKDIKPSFLIDDKLLILGSQT